MRFCAIDFETATSEQHSACAVAIVTVEDGKILDEFYSLIQMAPTRANISCTRVAKRLNIPVNIVAIVHLAFKVSPQGGALVIRMERIKENTLPHYNIYVSGEGLPSPNISRRYVVLSTRIFYMDNTVVYQVERGFE